jgi:tetratricopeptide (TPR) repeat protein
MNCNNRHIFASIVFVLLLLLTFTVYLPGLNGPFLFDDFGVLKSLESYGEFKNWEVLKLYIFGGDTGPLGRPLSMLSFLIDGVTFNNPWQFKYTNLMIHLLNGCVLCWLVLKIECLRSNGVQSIRATWVAILVAGIWLLHPFNISTTLYVVQRMAMLSGLFSLVGLLGYTMGRIMLVDSPRKAYLVMSLSVIFGSVLAVLSKENGCLLPVYILAFEAIIFKNRLPSINKTWKRLFLLLPSFILLAYFTHYIVFGRFINFYGMRTFSVMERLMTEARILFDYLGHWFFPYDMPRGLYADDYRISEGLFAPLSTIISILGIGGLCIIAMSRACPSALRLAISFYFIGHLIESTILPLELYFEHRNYLPAIFLFYPVILLMEKLIDKAYLKLGLSILVVIVLAGVTYERSSLWASEYQLAKASIEHYPNSTRARRHLAQYYDDNGRIDLALEELLKIEKISLDDLSIKMSIYVYTCRIGNDPRSRFQELLELLKNESYKKIEDKILKSIIMITHEGRCNYLGRESAHQMLDVLSNNNDYKNKPGLIWMLSHLKGHIFSIENNGELALAEFMFAQNYHGKVEAGLQQVAILATYKNYKEALMLLQKIETIFYEQKKDSEIFKVKLDYKDEIKMLREVIENDLNSLSQY